MFCSYFAVYLIGFCDSLLDMLQQYMSGYNGILALPGDRSNDLRLLGAVTLVLILGLAAVGMDWVTRVQIGLMFILLCSQRKFFPSIRCYAHILVVRE